MTVGLLGTGPFSDARRTALAAHPQVVLAPPAPPLPDLVAMARAEVEDGLDQVLGGYLDALDAAFVAVPPSDHFRVAEAVIRRGVPAFLEWPPAASVSECATLVDVAEEAGVEVGVSQPLRVHPAVAALPPDRRAALILVRREVVFPEASAPPWSRWLAETLDLCCTLAQSHSVQRVDVEAVRRTSAWPVVVAFGLRFHSGTYAQVSLRPAEKTPRGTLFVADSEGDREIDLTTVPLDHLITFETRAFVDALLAQQPAPHPVLDALQTMRLTERMLAKLR
jgi:predicted dehydrogenase